MAKISAPSERFRETWTQLRLFLGDASTSLARLYAELPREVCCGENWKLGGTLEGPFKKGGHTLPARFVWRDMGEGATLLAEAVIPDPCFWMPREPFLYRCHLQLIDAEGRVRDEFTCDHGFRPLMTRDSSIFLAGRRWVPRGILGGPARTEADLPSWEACGAVPVVRKVDPRLFAAASQMGIPVIVWLKEQDSFANDMWSIVQREASVVMVICRDVKQLDLPASPSSHNLLLAQECSEAEPVHPADWADLVVSLVEEPGTFAQWIAHVSLPTVVARRANDSGRDLQSLRTACDRLQRELASQGDYAGYLVEQEPA